MTHMMRDVFYSHCEVYCWMRNEYGYEQEKKINTAFNQDIHKSYKWVPLCAGWLSCQFIRSTKLKQMQSTYRCPKNILKG